MKALFLGTGTSVGVPVIGCDCPVCLSDNPKNRRRRTSLYLQTNEQSILIDCTPDFRDQALTYKMPRVDAVLFTHVHADHIFGFDDIRRYNTMQNSAIPAFATAEALTDLKRIFDYIGTEKVPGLYRPQIYWKEISEPFTLGSVRITPLPVIHSPKSTVGFLFEEDNKRLAYIPDCKSIPDSTLNLIKGADVMILDALRRSDHRTHMTLEESVTALKEINAGQSYTVHMCHNLDHADMEKELPAGMSPAYDGLTISL